MILAAVLDDTQNGAQLLVHVMIDGLGLFPFLALTLEQLQTPVTQCGLAIAFLLLEIAFLLLETLAFLFEASQVAFEFGELLVLIVCCRIAKNGWRRSATIRC